MSTGLHVVEDPRLAPSVVARELGVSRGYIYKLIECGRLAAEEFPGTGGRRVVRVPRSAVDEFRSRYVRRTYPKQLMPRPKAASDRKACADKKTPALERGREDKLCLQSKA